jgi:hypothetical protein
VEVDDVVIVVVPVEVSVEVNDVVGDVVIVDVCVEKS